MIDAPSPVQPRQDIAPAGQVTFAAIQEAVGIFYATHNNSPYTAMGNALKAVWPIHQPDSTARDGALFDAIRAQVCLAKQGDKTMSEATTAILLLARQITHPESPAVEQNGRVAILEEALTEAHDALHRCTAVLSSNDSADVAAVMRRARRALASSAPTEMDGGAGA